MIIYGKTDKGMVRKDNQDAFFISDLPDNAALAVVCDGMGGANAGNIASKMAVGHISNFILNSYRSSMTSDSIIKTLKSALISANIELYNAAISDFNLKGMGTTAVAAIYKDSSAFICNIGDSRAYKVNSEITQITRDHSVVQSLVESGELTAEEARNHPNKNMITRALGTEKNVMPDCYEISMKEDDKLLICTDGLTDFLNNSSILIQFSGEIENVPDKLIAAANSAGGGDNITAVVLLKERK